MPRDEEDCPAPPAFEHTVEDPAAPHLPSVCRHIRSNSAQPFRQAWVWSARRGPDIMGTYRRHLVLCARCWSVMTEIAEVCI